MNLAALTIEVKVNGISLKVLVDSGTQPSCLDPRIVTRLGLKSDAATWFTTPYSSGAASEVHVQTFDIASLHIENVPMIVMDVSTMSSASGLQLDGIMSTDFLKLAPIKLDFSKNAAELVSRSAIPSSSIYGTSESEFSPPQTPDCTPILNSMASWEQTFLIPIRNDGFGAQQVFYFSTNRIFERQPALLNYRHSICKG